MKWLTIKKFLGLKVETGVKKAAKAAKAALMAIQALEEEIEEIPKRKHVGDEYYSEISMEKAEEAIESKLNEINKLVAEYNLENEVYEECRRKAEEIIYNAAISRKEYEWAAAFAKKHNF
ncbi:MAG: hypothetical protein Q8N28_03075 [bacterium]|nr:hypothetical protein [bacterium]